MGRLRSDLGPIKMINEFDFEQLGAPENIDDFDQMKFCARPTYFNSKDRGN